MSREDIFVENAICPECEKGGKIMVVDGDDDIVFCCWCNWNGKVCELDWRPAKSLKETKDGVPHGK